MFLYKSIFCDPSLEPSRRDSSNEGSQHMFTLRNKKNLSLNYSQYPLSYGVLVFTPHLCIVSCYISHGKIRKIIPKLSCCLLSGAVIFSYIHISGGMGSGTNFLSRTPEEFLGNVDMDTQDGGMYLSSVYNLQLV